MNLSPKKTYVGDKVCYTFECEELQEELKKQIIKKDGEQEDREFAYFPAMIVYKPKKK